MNQCYERIGWSRKQHSNWRVHSRFWYRLSIQVSTMWSVFHEFMTYLHFWLRKAHQGSQLFLWFASCSVQYMSMCQTASKEWHASDSVLPQNHVTYDAYSHFRIVVARRYKNLSGWRNKEGEWLIEQEKWAAGGGLVFVWACEQWLVPHLQTLCLSRLVRHRQLNLPLYVRVFVPR